MADTIFKVGRIFKGRLGAYTLTKQLQESVWVARYASYVHPAAKHALEPYTRIHPNRPSSNQEREAFIFKSVRHWRLQNERDVLRRFQSRTPHVRPLVDEIEDPPALVLKYLEDDALRGSNLKTLARYEVKFVARGVLEALSVLHGDGFVHTGTNPAAAPPAILPTFPRCCC